MYEELEPQHGSVVLADNPMKQLEPSSPKVHPAVSQTATLTVPLLFNVHSFKHLIYAQDF